jgi:serine protease AprX
VATIPDFVVEYFLLGRTRHNSLDRYTQDGGIVSDVWLAFAKDLHAPQRVLVAPNRDTSAVDLGYALHKTVMAYRRGVAPPRENPGVSPLEAFVVVKKLYFDELLRVVLPMTLWWHDKSLSALHRKAARSGTMLEEMLERVIRQKLGLENDEVSLRQTLVDSPNVDTDRRIIMAASLAALIGVFQAAAVDPTFLTDLQGIKPRTDEGWDSFVGWIHFNAEKIAIAARQELARPLLREILSLPPSMQGLTASTQTQTDEPPVLVHRVFLDREASLSNTSAVCTIKADAAVRVFDISCKDITWAIIDSGIASVHPAFEDHDRNDCPSQVMVASPNRVRATYDFTRIERIKNFDLTLEPDGSPGRQRDIQTVVGELATMPGRIVPPNFNQDSTRNLESIVRQLEQRISPDWALIEPLIRWNNNDSGTHLLSDHGTHVAGTLAGDWRVQRSDGRQQVFLQGVCPDLNLFDLRVIHHDRDPLQRAAIRSTESAIIAALDFVQFVNSRAAGHVPVIHGVNISLSIPHDVHKYGCGSTPICVECDRVVNSGVVVIVAAGNRGWNEQELGFGNFVFSSITDPGNAREVVTVGSTHSRSPHTYGISYFSSRGPTGDGRIKPDLVAPGEAIRGPIRGGADDELDGTSMAAPFVSGAAAMLMARYRELIGNPNRVKQILCDSATDLGRERYFQGHGLLDVLRALQSV